MGQTVSFKGIQQIFDQYPLKPQFGMTFDTINATDEQAWHESFSPPRRTIRMLDLRFSSLGVDK